MAAVLNPVLTPLPEEEEQDTGVRPYQWTVEAFYRAIELGAFEHPERLELMDGEIIDHMSPQQNPHAQTVGYVSDALREVFGTAHHLRTQGPLDVSRITEPEPDVFVIRGKRREYDRRKPTPADVLLLVEVSDTTLGYDRNRKAARYAEAGIEEYWVLNLNARWLEARREPSPMPDTKYGFGYKSVKRYAEEDTVSPLHAPQAEIKVNDLFPASVEEAEKSDLS